MTRFDRNFNGLAERFARKVYGGLKGDIRLAVIWRDLQQALPVIQDGKPLRVIDIGGGMGQISQRLAGLGHSVLVNDISEEMLALGRQQVAGKSFSGTIDWQCGPYQALDKSLHSQYDLVLCHALLEWLAEPQLLIAALKNFMKPGGTLSLTFYNQHSLVYRNLIRGNFKLLDAGFRHDDGSLTPKQPLLPGTVTGWLNEAGLQLVASSGIRVFHDYVITRSGGHQDGQAVIAKELAYSTQEPFKWLGRYIHFVAK